MTTKAHDTGRFSGFLLESPSTKISRDELNSVSGLSFKEQIRDTNWEKYQFRCEQALLREDRFGVKGPYTYPLVCRPSHRRMILLSSSKDVVEHMVHNEFLGRFHPSLRAVPIEVDQLVKSLVIKPTRYAICYVHARVPAFGALLRSVSFYGEDLSEASFFKDNVDLMTYFSCGLCAAGSKKEIVRLSSDGGVSFFSSYGRQLNVIDHILKFLSSEGYISKQIIDD